MTNTWQELSQNRARIAASLSQVNDYLINSQILFNRLIEYQKKVIFLFNNARLAYIETIVCQYLNDGVFLL